MKNLVEQIKNIVKGDLIEEEIHKESFLLKFKVKNFLNKKQLGLDQEEINLSGYEDSSGDKIQVISYRLGNYVSHQQIGESLDLFFFSKYSPGMPFFKNKGLVLYEEMKKIAKNIYKAGGYEEIISPEILDISLWKKSGHFDFYKENMYVMEGDNLAIKPMNCPGHIIFYKNKKRNEGELPLRVGELGKVHRKEKSGSIQGLFRVRAFIQDDAHVFLKQDQIQQEISKIIKEALNLYKKLGFDEVKINFSSKPESKYVGEDSLWEKSESELKKALSEYEYKEKKGDGAFYGPKIDFHIKDSLGREHQVGSIQLDFNLPNKFNLKYYNGKGEAMEPVMIHRALYGSLERFMGLLLEHHKGWIPEELAPVQLAILPVYEGFEEKACEIGEKLGLRFSVKKDDSLKKRIKQCFLEKIPFQIILGEKELEQGKVIIKNLKNGEKKEFIF